MFKNLFKKTINEDQETQSHLTDPRKMAFEELIICYFIMNGILEFDNKDPAIHLKELIKKNLNFLGFEENIEEVILNEWQKSKDKNANIDPSVFLKDFIIDFHNQKIEDFVPDFIKERNKKFIGAYQTILITIERMQALLEDENLKMRVESDFRKHPNYQSTIFQCTTAFCIISLGCDQMGRYNLVYSVDYRLKEMLSINMANVLIRRIYEFTPDSMGSFVFIGSLYEDCYKVLNNLIEESKSVSNHKVIKVT